MIVDFETKKSRGFGFVEFESKEVVQKVLKLDHYLFGKKLQVKPMKLKKEIREEKVNDNY